jgi:Ca2+-binding EF-hand superfamily protein
MRHIACVLCVALGCGSARAGDDKDKLEEQAVNRCAQQKAQRVQQIESWERAATIRDLDGVFPGKVSKAEPGKVNDEGEAWFLLVAGTREDWRKTDAMAAGLGPMYDRWAGRLNIGMAPSIKHEEFVKFAELIINNARAGLAQGETDNAINAEAERMFQVLDVKKAGALTRKEMTLSLIDEKGKFDTDNDGRISSDEYREYFRYRVEKKAAALVIALRANEEVIRKLVQEGPEKKNGLPNWFSKLDKDKKGQVSLFEWRKAGRDIAEFEEMDLNGDGLLTADEYLRWAKMKDAAKDQKRREADRRDK